MTPSPTTEPEQLLALARIYAAAEKVDLSTVSWRVFGDTKKFAALDGGADLVTKRYREARQWFSDHWPAEAIWPHDVPRPDPQEAAA